MKHLRYLKYVLRHKWFVMLACFKEGLYWRGIVHDWHKFLPDEFFPYAENFYGKGASGIKTGRDSTGYYDPTKRGDEFLVAWFRHQKRADHHWQYWTMPADGPGDRLRVFQMPDKCRREMICDWIGAGRAQRTPGVPDWWKKNGDKLILHAETRWWVEGRIAGMEKGGT